MPKDYRRVQQLIYLAEVNFLICEKIYKALPDDALKYLKHQNFLLISANNAFNETINILHTLLSSQKKEELRIKPILQQIINADKPFTATVEDQRINKFVKKMFEDYPSINYYSYDFLFDDDKRVIGEVLADICRQKRQSGLVDLESIKKEFEQHNFHKIRHQSVAHKNKHLKNPAGAANLYLLGDYIKNLGSVMKKLRINSYFWFGYSLENPYGQVIGDLYTILDDSKKV